MNITREDWVDLISLDSKHPINTRLGAKFICQEEVKKTESEILYRLCFEDIKSKRLFCIKYVLFKDKDGNPDIAVNTPYTDKIYKI